VAVALPESSIYDDWCMRFDPVRMAAAAGFPALDPWQRQLLVSRASKIMMLCSRQVGKSTAAGLLATWIARYTSNAQILICSPTARQSEELLRTVRAIWQRLPESGVTASSDTLTRLEASNGSRILALPGSKGDSIRGLSGIDVLILDEAARCSIDLVAAIRPMLAISNGRLVILTTPAGRVGWFPDEWEHGIGYQRFSVRADECPRISKEFLDSERRALGPTWYSQEYENAFVNAENAVFPEAYLQRIISEEEHAWTTIPPPQWAQPNPTPILQVESWTNGLQIPERDPRMTAFGVPWP